MAKPIIALYNGRPTDAQADRICKKLDDYHVFFFEPKEQGEQIQVFNIDNDDIEDITIEELKEIVDGTRR